MLPQNPFFEIAAILGLATVLGFIGQKLRQPLIIMFLATGILAGPALFGIIHSYEQIDLFAHIGIALLLFIVGLKLDFHLIRTTGPVALATGIGQIVFTSAIGLLIALAMGMSMLSAAYVAVALTFSSTIIIVKLLSDKKEIDALHGQIAIGFLIVQDIAAIIALVVLTTFGADLTEGGSVWQSSLQILLKGFGLLAAVGLLMRYVLPWLTQRLAYSQEMLTLFAIAWAVALSAVSELLGFSQEVGAFLAGISLASTGYRDAISGRLTSLRDFLLLFFFIDLGARLDWSTVGAQLGNSAIFSIFVLIGNPLIVLAIMGFMGYRRRTGFLAGLTVAQISEFSLIVAALGLSLGHIDAETMGLITLVGVVTIFASTYMILYSGPLYRFLSRPLMIFERSNPYREVGMDSVREPAPVDVLLIGMGRYGSDIAEHLLRQGKSIVGVDFDPGSLQKWRTRGIPVIYGDIADPELYDHLPLDQARWIVSTVRSIELDLPLLQLLKLRDYQGRIAVAAGNQLEADLYQKANVQLVLMPYKDAAEQAADALTHAMDVLPKHIDWPTDFQEIRIQSGSAFAGQRVRDIPLRAHTGASILAVSRAGRVHYDPSPDFQIYPGDRLLLMGSPDELRHAEQFLTQFHDPQSANDIDHFAVAEVQIGVESQRHGQTLADLQFRQRYGVTVVGIQRGADRMLTPGPSTGLIAGDHLIVIGNLAAVEKIKAENPL
ncbi:MAG: cation:proton antiporter [Caldilineaceae bacterium]|nr:cation:proton antiporter [Caldilineaceae bacterium]